jgi:polyisoprenoid-binding protein YceI
MFLRRDGFDTHIITQQLSHRAVMLAMLCAILLAACQSPLPAEPPAVAIPSTTEPAAQHGKRYIIDAQASEIRLLVYRDGPMARVGHNHVMNGQVNGELDVSDSAAASSFKLDIPVASFTVDDPALRAEEGEDFSATVSDPARKGTRDNMLGADVLDASHFALIRIESESMTGPRWNPAVNARITVRDKTSVVKFPAAVIERPDALTVIATFRVLQTDLGITPYSILGGAVRVRDAIDIRVRLVARPAVD